MVDNHEFLDERREGKDFLQSIFPFYFIFYFFSHFFEGFFLIFDCLLFVVLCGGRGRKSEWFTEKFIQSRGGTHCPSHFLTCDLSLLFFNLILCEGFGHWPVKDIHNENVFLSLLFSFSFLPSFFLTVCLSLFVRACPVCVWGVAYYIVQWCEFTICLIFAFESNFRARVVCVRDYVFFFIFLSPTSNKIVNSSLCASFQL